MRSSLEEILKVEVVAEIRKKATMTNFIEKIINCSFCAAMQIKTLLVNALYLSSLVSDWSM